MNTDFNFAGTPEIIFGPGKIDLLTKCLLSYGSTVLVLTGAKSFRLSTKFDILIKTMEENHLKHYQEVVSGEPTPDYVNRVVAEMSDKSIDVVVAIGGGSVIDASKAVSAMLGKIEGVENYLEGVGTKTHDGTKIPLIAVPTTSGTGSEATKNTVLSHIGTDGFKKSMRHKNFVPNIALVDPELTITCPLEVTAACGMDAFTQLLESYVSSSASPMTDALAYQGIKYIKKNIIPAASSGARNLEVRTAMSYASLLSGITLANAGLGIVHGLASSIGSFFDIPHGVVCGTLVGAATKINIENMRKDKDKNLKGITKYAEIGQLLSEDQCQDKDECCDYLITQIEQWIQTLNLSKLGIYGVSEKNIDKIVQNTGNKSNPVKLDKADIEKIVRERL